MFLLPVFVVRHHSEKMIAKNIELPLHQPCGNVFPARVATPLLTSQRRPKATGKYYVKMKNYAWANHSIIATFAMALPKGVRLATQIPRINL